MSKQNKKCNSRKNKQDLLDINYYLEKLSINDDLNASKKAKGKSKQVLKVKLNNGKKGKNRRSNESDENKENNDESNNNDEVEDEVDDEEETNDNDEDGEDEEQEGEDEEEGN